MGRDIERRYRRYERAHFWQQSTRTVSFEIVTSRNSVELYGTIPER